LIKWNIVGWLWIKRLELLNVTGLTSFIMYLRIWTYLINIWMLHIIESEVLLIYLSKDNVCNKVLFMYSTNGWWDMRLLNKFKAGNQFTPKENMIFYIKMIVCVNEKKHDQWKIPSVVVHIELT
jgi:hypothetical protein